MGVIKLHFRHPIWYPLWCPYFELDSLSKIEINLALTLGLKTRRMLLPKKWAEMRP